MLGAGVVGPPICRVRTGAALSVPRPCCDPRCQADGAAFRASAGSAFLQRAQVAHHAVGRTDVHVFTDLSDGDVVEPKSTM